MKIILIFGFIAAVTCCDSNEIGGMHRVTHQVWFEITIGNQTYPQRIVIGLFGKVVPVTVQNFVNLAEMPMGQGYKGSKIHLINREVVCGGQWMKVGNEIRGRSSYDDPEFDDENHEIKHYGAGWVSSDPYGEDRHTSLFLITLQKLTRLDSTTCVVFGKVISGMPLVKQIAQTPTNKKGVPLVNVIISDCGGGFADPPFFVAKDDAIE